MYLHAFPIYSETQIGNDLLLGNNFRVGAFFVEEVLYILIYCKYNVNPIPDPGYYILQIDICMFVFCIL